MKIVIGYPPIPEAKGAPQVAQNRQFQYFNEPTYIYPVIPAYAATLLKSQGHEVHWMDGPAEGKTWEEYKAILYHLKPDLIFWEVKTPTVKRVWKLVNEIKIHVPRVGMVLMGDHITAMPDESLKACDVDTVIVGGDYDFAMADIVAHNFLGGVYKSDTQTPLTELPLIDRELTKWKLYGYKNGNFKYLPGTYTMFGRDCWWRKDGGCTFCSWTTLFKNFRVVSVEQALDEIKHCHSLGIREVFDDTGTFPVGKWLHEFCEKVIKWKEKTHSKIRIGCNMRPGALKQDEFKLISKAGFRFILFGLESANHETLERINKGQKAGDMVESARLASRAGLHPHVTCMVGYPWESLEDARKTIEFTRALFREGWIETLQATIVIPYPGTQLYKEALANGWLVSQDWNRYDMREPMLRVPDRTGVPMEWQIRDLAQGIYKSCITPKFILRKVLSIRDIDDIKFITRAGKYVLGHLKDFAKTQVKPVH